MSAVETTAVGNEVDHQIENIRRRCDSALQRRLNNPDCLSPATLIRILSPVIERYLAAGLLLEEVAKALQEEGFKITKGHLVRHLGSIRAENGLPQIKKGRKVKAQIEGGEDAPPAQNGGEQREAGVQVAAPAPAPAPVAAAEPNSSAARVLSEKEKIDLIVETIPAPDRDYPELVDLRYWEDEKGSRWDVTHTAKDAPDNVLYRRACLIYMNTRRGLFEKWGLGKIITGGTLKLRYTLEDKPPLTVDLDQIITKHLILS